MRTTFIATGDSFITRRIPDKGYSGFEDLKTLIEKHDVRFPASAEKRCSKCLLPRSSLP